MPTMSPLSSWRKLFLATAGVAALAVPVVAGLLTSSFLEAQATAAQSPTVPQWQIDAGGKMAFDAASVKPNKSNDRPSSNVNLVSGAIYTPNGGLFSAKNMPLINYIVFAYRMGGNQGQQLAPHLPKWVLSDRFDIEARAAVSNPTKDQIRLMVQSLLADRFKLAIHTETDQLPAFALVLVKPGKTGPQLQLDNSPCTLEQQTVPMILLSAPPSAASSTSGLQLPPMPCGGIPPNIGSSAVGRVRTGGRMVTINAIGSELDNRPLEVDRPLLDRTSLNGTFDFSLEWTPNMNGASDSASYQTDPTGPTFQEALKDQLGLKLEPIAAPIDVFVVDHIEEPSPN